MRCDRVLRVGLGDPLLLLSGLEVGAGLCSFRN
jgi:hypothetical protein